GAPPEPSPPADPSSAASRHLLAAGGEKDTRAESPSPCEEPPLAVTESELVLDVVQRMKERGVDRGPVVDDARKSPAFSARQTSSARACRLSRRSTCLMSGGGQHAGKRNDPTGAPRQAAGESGVDASGRI